MKYEIYNILKKIYKKTVGIVAKPINYQRIKNSSNSLISLRNIHSGQRCFIIGNGPSLNANDLDKLKDEICFGCNGIYNIYSKTEWRPTYYCSQDIVYIMSNRKKIIAQTIKNKFLAIDDKILYPPLGSALYIRFIREEYDVLPKFSSDIVEGIYDGSTVSYMCMQIAAYMGFKEIILLGFDHNYSAMVDENGNIIHQPDVKDHFSSTDKISNLPRLHNSTLAYQAAKKYADKHGIRIYNATRGGKLEVFERISFDELF